MWQKEEKDRKGLSWFIYRCLGQFAWLVVCSCQTLLSSTWHCTISQIWESQTSTSGFQEIQSHCHPLRFDICALFSQKPQVIPQERWQWWPALVQIIQISPHKLLTLEWHLTMVAIKKGLQDLSLISGFLLAPQLYLYELTNQKHSTHPNTTRQFSKLFHFFHILVIVLSLGSWCSKNPLLTVQGQHRLHIGILAFQVCDEDEPDVFLRVMNMSCTVPVALITTEWDVDSFKPRCSPTFL